MVMKSMQVCITCEIFFDQDKKIRFNWMEMYRTKCCEEDYNMNKPLRPIK